jgi:hypothetical protein
VRTHEGSRRGSEGQADTDGVWCVPARGVCRSFFVFIIFYGLATYILLDMFIAVVLDNFTYWYDQSSAETGGHSRTDFRKYVHTVPTHALAALCLMLPAAAPCACPSHLSLSLSLCVCVCVCVCGLGETRRNPA